MIKQRQIYTLSPKRNKYHNSVLTQLNKPVEGNLFEYPRQRFSEVEKLRLRTLFKEIKTNEIYTSYNNRSNLTFVIYVDLESKKIRTELNNSSKEIKELKVNIFNILFRKDWEVAGIEPPNNDCKEIAFEFASNLYKNNNLYPRRINSSIEEGLMLNYFNSINNKELFIEIYNDKDIVASLTQNKKEILDVVEVNNIYDIKALIKNYNESLSPTFID